MKKLRCFSLLASLVLFFSIDVFAQTTFYPARGVFNGYLEQVNIVECDNTGSKSVKAVLSLQSSNGTLLGKRELNIAGFGTVHTILDDLAPIRDTYGTYQVTLEDPLLGDFLHCRTAFYRSSVLSQSKVFEYAYTLPVRNPQLGKRGGIYNSIDPGKGGGTLNWLSIINLDASSFSADVKVFASNGRVAATVPVRNLLPGGRQDIPLGHTQGQVTGLYQIVPKNTTQLYEAFLIRYNQNGSGGYNFAFPLRAQSGNCSGETLLASTMGNGLTDNWLEIGNLTEIETSPIGVTIEVRDRAGNLLTSQRRQVVPFGQTHFYLSSVIDPQRQGNVGSVRVLCDDPSDRLVVQTTFYGRHPQVPGVEWAYSAQTQEGVTVGDSSVLSAPVNTYLGMANWLKLANQRNQSTTLIATVFDQKGNPVEAREHLLRGNATADIGVHELLGWDRVGTVVAESNLGVGGEILRVSLRDDGQIGTIVSVPGIVQQKGLSSGSFRGDPQSLAPYRDLLTKEEVRHLLTRTSFGATATEQTKAHQEGLRKSVAKLLKFVPASQVEADAFNWVNGTPDPQETPVYTLEGVRRWWLYLMVHSPNPLKEKLSLVLHDLFAASCRVINTTRERKFCYEHIQLIRAHAKGNFLSLAKAMNTDYLMLVWLNGNQNVAGVPDENYTRELWELFTLGEASRHEGRWPLYKDADIKEASRAFTGWATVFLNNTQQTVFIPNNYDDGVKTIWKGTPYEARGRFAANDITELTLARPETAQFVARRLFAAFIHDHPSDAVIGQLVDLLRRNNWELEPVIRTLLLSEAMFSGDARNSRVKDPVTYAVGFLRSTQIPMTMNFLETEVRSMGLVPTDPPAVNGWPGNKFRKGNESEFFLAWSPQYTNFITEVFRRMGSHNLALLLPHSSATAEQTLEHLAELLDVTPSSEERTQYLEYLNHYLTFSEQLINDPFNAASSTHVRNRVAGLLWLLSQHRQYFTF